jgi:pre-mRNA-processing factor 17
VDPRSHLVFHNPKVEELFLPNLGPSQPGARAKVAPGQLNTLTGFVENDSLSDAVFKQQFVQFNQRGYAVDPSQGNFGYGAYVMSAGAQPQTGVYHLTVLESIFIPLARAGGEILICSDSVEENIAPRRRKKKNDNPTKDPSNVDEYKGPWATAGQDRGLSGPPEAAEGDAEAGDENTAQANQSDEEGAAPAPKRQRRNKEPSSEVGGVFHGTAMRDSLNKSWIEPPAGLKERQDKRLARVRGEDISSDVIKMMQAGSEGEVSAKDVGKKWKPSSDVTCYLPKRVIHEWKGHEGPVWKSTLFPRYGHLMMSCSTDKTIKVRVKHTKFKAPGSSAAPFTA